MKVEELLLEKAVMSSWITSLTYNRKNKILTMNLNNGNSYFIFSVSRSLFDKWNLATSKVKFFHLYIKNLYRIQRA